MTITQEHILVKLFHSIGEPINMDNFRNRLKMQKITYLFQALNFPIEYPFEWGYKGPYSGELNNTLFNIVNKTETMLAEVEHIPFGENEKRLLGNVKKAVNFECGYDNALWIEILGTAVFLRYRGNFTDQEILNKMTVEKNLPGDLTQHAIDQLNILGITPQKQTI